MQSSRLLRLPATSPSALLRSKSASRAFHVSARSREHFLDATPEVFDKQVINQADKNRLVLVDFYADWCGPCKTLSPILEKVTSDTSLTGGKQVDLVTVDTDAQIELAQKYKVRALPTVTAFKDGKPLGHFVGAIPQEKLKEAIAKWLVEKP